VSPFSLSQLWAQSTPPGFPGPALYPAGLQLSADLRFRQSRLKVKIPGAGRFEHASVNGKKVRLNPDGALPLNPAFAGGDVAFLP
jgi:hypothetical protein